MCFGVPWMKFVSIKTDDCERYQVGLNVNAITVS